MLNKKTAAGVVVDDGYGHTLQEGFQRVATDLGIEAHYFAFRTPEEAEQIALSIATDPARPPIIFLTLDGDAARMLMTLRRHSASGPFLGGDALGDPGRLGAESYREPSGFHVSIAVVRRAAATLAKILMPLLLMTVIMFASLYFPHGLVKERSPWRLPAHCRARYC